MKKMKTYRKAPLSFGHLPEGERRGRRLPAGQVGKSEDQSSKREVGFGSLLNHYSNLLAPLSPFIEGDESRVLGTEGVENPKKGEKNIEYQITNNESGSILGTPISDSPSKGRAGLFLIIYFLFSSFRNIEHRITFTGLAANPDGARSSVRVGTTDKSGTVSSKGRNNMLPDVIIQQQRPETTPGRVEIAPGIKKMTHGRVKIAPEFKKMTQGQVKTAPGFKKMTPGRVKIAQGIRKMTHGRVKTAPGRVEYAPGPLPAPHGAIFRCAVTAIGETAAAPQNICSTNGLPSEKKVQHTETLNGNIEHRITKTGLAANPDGARSSVRVGRPEKPEIRKPVSYFLFSSFRNNEYRIRNVESGKNIPVLRTFGFHWNSSATNITGALHPGFQTAVTVIGETAAAPRNICSTNGLPSGKKVQRTEQLKENNEQRITNQEVRRRAEGIPSGEDRRRNLTSNDTSTNFLSPSPFGEGRGEAFLPHLPRGSFYSGDCPGAAAITIIFSLFSSPRVSPMGNVEFSHSDPFGVTPHSIPCGVLNSASRSACKGLQVINQSETNGFPWYCHPAGRYSGQGTSPHPERPLQRTKKERRYAYVLN